MTHYSAIIVGGGQAGLSASYYLQQLDIDHLVLEKHTLTHTWRNQRWDAFCLVTPNWQCALPGYPYAGDDPHGFMKKDQIIAYLDGFIAKVNAPVREGVTVQRMTARAEGGYLLNTSAGDFSADQVIVASGGYHTPIIPRLAERLPVEIKQIHSEQYRNPQALPQGAVLVVGSGQSGAQIAEDLHLAGRNVFLAVGDAPRCARFYRGKDVVDWLAEMGYYDIGVDTHPLREGVRDNTNHYVTGRDGGRDIDLRRFAQEGMTLFGRLQTLQGSVLSFAPDLAANLDGADAVYNRINASIDTFIAKKGSRRRRRPADRHPHERADQTHQRAATGPGGAEMDRPGPAQSRPGTCQRRPRPRRAISGARSRARVIARRSASSDASSIASISAARSALPAARRSPSS